MSDLIPSCSLNNLYKRRDGGQRITDFVRNAGGEQPDTFDLLSVEKSLSKVFLFRNIAVNAKIPVDLSAGVEDRRNDKMRKKRLTVPPAIFTLTDRYFARIDASTTFFPRSSWDVYRCQKYWDSC